MKRILIMFCLTILIVSYSDCLQVRVLFDSASLTLAKSDELKAKLGRVDCGSEGGKSICQKYEIVGFPTILGFSSDLTHIKWNDRGTEETIVEHVLSEASQPMIDLQSAEERSAFVQLKKPEEAKPKLGDRDIDPDHQPPEDAEAIHGIINTKEDQNPYGVKLVIDVAKGSNQDYLTSALRKVAQTIRRNEIQTGVYTSPVLIEGDVKITLHRDFDPKEVNLNLDLAKAKLASKDELVNQIVTFVHNNSFPALGEIKTVVQFQLFLKSTLPRVWIFADGDYDFKLSELHHDIIQTVLKPAIMGSVGDAGTTFGELFTLGCLSHKQWQHNARSFGLLTPTVSTPRIVIDDRANGRKYIGDFENKGGLDLTIANFQTFLTRFLNNELTPFYKSQPLPPTSITAPSNRIQTIVGKNYNDVVLNDLNHDAVVLYTTPWQCRRQSSCDLLKEKLVKLIQADFSNDFNIVFTEIDTIENDIASLPDDFNTPTSSKKESTSPSGFDPILYIFPRSNKANPVRFPFEEDIDLTKALKSFIHLNRNPKTQSHDEL